MFRKSFFTIVLATLGLLMISAAAYAQTAPVSGTVELKKADGSREPVAGALIEVYRTDIKSGFPSAKTNKKGEFTFAGIPLGGTYSFGVSGPGCAPTIVPGVKAGQEKLVVSLSPGDGSKMSEDDVRKGSARVAGAGTGSGQAPVAEMTEEQKKAKAEYDANVAAITEKNAKALKTNEVVSAALKEGNDAFTAKNYDLAITKYNAGIEADPAFVGSTPIFHNNRGTALLQRAVDNYNKAIKATDVNEKIAGLASVKKDFMDASDGYLKAFNIEKNAAATDIADKANFESTKMSTLKGAKEIFRMAVKTEQVDATVIEAAKVLIPEYLSVETDPVKKAEASLAFADLYRVVGDSDNAIASYKAILDGSPENADALLGAGLSLVNLGYINNDKTKLQEGANMLQHFASIAPDSNKFKPDAVALIETLKKEQNVTPVKTTPAKKKP